MDQRISMVTLGVRDVGLSRRFYEQGLGWRASLVSAPALVVFRTGAMLVGLLPRRELAAEMGLDDADRTDDFAGMALSHAVGSREDAILILARAEAAGALITRRTAETDWGGYAGAFTDPDGHAWEVTWNPDWFDDYGRVLIT